MASSHALCAGEAAGIYVALATPRTLAVTRWRVRCHSGRQKLGEIVHADIEAYVASGEPMDKAGSYGIQGLGGQFVDRIEGCYFNVMGFPMRRFSTEFSALLQEGC